MTGEVRPHTCFPPRRARPAAAALAGLVLLLGLPHPGTLGAQAPPEAPTVLVLTHALDAEAEQTFQSVVAVSLRLALERRGLKVLHESRPASASGLSVAPATLFASGAAAGADHVLAGDYTTAGTDLEIRLAWYERGKAAASATLTRRGRRDLALDRMILQAAEEILRSANPTLAVSPARPVQPPGPSGGSGSVPAAEQAPPGHGGQTAEDGRAVPGAELPPVGQPGRERPKRLDIGLGVAPFVTTGSASEYFKFGVVPVLSAAYLFRGEQGRIGLGLYAGANLFNAEGSLESASAFLVPMGVAVRYEIGGETAPLIVFGLSGGPALIGLTPEGEERLVGLTLFGRATLGIRLPIGEVFGIAAEAGYDIYWEQPYPIMGFCPAVYATIRL